MRGKKRGRENKGAQKREAIEGRNGKEMKERERERERNSAMEKKEYTEMEGSKEKSVLVQ